MKITLTKLVNDSPIQIYTTTHLVFEILVYIIFIFHRNLEFAF